MDEAVARIVGAAPVHALPLGLAPGRGGTNFVDRAHGPKFPACRLEFLEIFPELPDRAPTVSARPAHFKGRLRSVRSLAPMRRKRVY